MIVIVGYHVYVDYSFKLLSVIIFGLFLIITNPQKSIHQCERCEINLIEFEICFFSELLRN